MVFGEAFMEDEYTQRSNDEPIERQKVPQSCQPRFRDKQEALFYWIDTLEKWSKEAIITVPPYSPDSRALDAWRDGRQRNKQQKGGARSMIISVWWSKKCKKIRIALDTASQFWKDVLLPVIETVNDFLIDAVRAAIKNVVTWLKE